MTTASTAVPITEVSKVLGVSRGTVYNAFKKNDIPHLHVTGRIVVPSRLFHSFLNGDWDNTLPCDTCGGIY